MSLTIVEMWSNYVHCHSNNLVDCSKIYCLYKQKPAFHMWTALDEGLEVVRVLRSVDDDAPHRLREVDTGWRDTMAPIRGDT